MDFKTSQSFSLKLEADFRIIIFVAIRNVESSTVQFLLYLVLLCHKIENTIMSILVT